MCGSYFYTERFIPSEVTIRYPPPPYFFYVGHYSSTKTQYFDVFYTDGHGGSPFRVSNPPVGGFRPVLVPVVQHNTTRIRYNRMPTDAVTLTLEQTRRVTRPSVSLWGSETSKGDTLGPVRGRRWRSGHFPFNACNVDEE